MMREEPEARRERLRLWTGGAALAGLEATQRAIEECGARPPRAGDLFLLTETSDLPVEWAVIDQDPGDPQRLLVVPADLNPLAGSGDVQVVDDSRSGALTLRCQFGIWLNAENLDLEMRSGFLEPEDLRRAQDRRTEVVRCTVSGSAIQREVDVDPEYGDWVEKVLKKAHATLASRPPVRGGGHRARAVRPMPYERSAFGIPYRLVASVVLLVGIAFGAGQLWEHRGIDRAQQRYREEVRELEQRLRAGRDQEAVPNLPFVFLAPKTEEVRGGGLKSLILPLEESRFLLALELRNLEPFPRYRLEIWGQEAAEMVWSSSEFTTIKKDVLSVLLPPHLLRVGVYRLDLYGLREGQPVPIDKYALRIERK